MSAANSIFNIVTLGFSLAAILVAVISAYNQAAAVRRGNLLAFMAEMGGLTRTPDFREAQDYVLTRLSENDPTEGITRLPRPARDYVWKVGGFYQDLGALVVTGVIDENLAVSLHYTGIKNVWRALAPYIIAERAYRRSRNGGGFFGSFEHIAVYVESVPIDKVFAKLHRRSFPSSDTSMAIPDDQVGEEGGTSVDL
jgi:hypothetical protein